MDHEKQMLDEQLDSLLADLEGQPRSRTTSPRWSVDWRRRALKATECVGSHFSPSNRRLRMLLVALGLISYWWISHWAFLQQGTYLVRRHVLAHHLSLTADDRLRILAKLDHHLAHENPITAEWSGRDGRTGVVTYETVKRARNCLHAEQLFVELPFWRRAFTYHPQDVRISDDGTCAEHLKVMIVSSDYCNGGLQQWTRGEDVQCRSMIQSLSAMGYGVVPLAKRSLQDMAYFHTLFEDLAKAFVVTPDAITELLNDPLRSWIDDSITTKAVFSGSFDSAAGESETKSHAIPLYNIFALDWWGVRENAEPRHPLGTEWYLTPFEIPGHTYVGFSIEGSCDPELVIAAENRTRSAVVLGKKLHYFQNLAWNEQTWPRLAREADVRIHAYVSDTKQEAMPPSIINHGYVSREEYSRGVAETSIMIGVGMPGSSPSPYVALCQGTPFVNIRRKGALPVDEWYKTNNIFQWQDYQHGPLASYGPPYVYNVEEGDEEGLTSAVISAVANPIGSWIPEEMTEVANRDRIAWIMERDWKAQGARRAKELGTNVAELAHAERARLIEPKILKLQQLAEAARAG